MGSMSAVTFWVFPLFCLEWESSSFFFLTRMLNCRNFYRNIHNENMTKSTSEWVTDNDANVFHSQHREMIQLFQEHKRCQMPSQYGNGAAWGKITQTREATDDLSRYTIQVTSLDHMAQIKIVSMMDLVRKKQCLGANRPDVPDEKGQPSQRDMHTKKTKEVCKSRYDMKRPIN